MATYREEVATEKNYIGNVVIKIEGRYFAVRKPDSGLDINYPHSNCVSSLVLNPTQLSPKSVTTAIGSNSLKLLDKEGVVSLLIKDRAANFIGKDIEIYLGRSGTGMDFSEYEQLPITRISKANKVDSAYTISTKESTDRMNRPVFDAATRLSGSILAGTTIIIAKDDISKFPASGSFYFNNELVDYASKDDDTKTFFGCARGAGGTVGLDQEDDEKIYLAEVVTDNPINIILKLLISNGGGGTYDVLKDGLGIAPSLIDIAEIESIRDSLFEDVEFTLALYNVDNALKYIEQQLLAACNVRFTSSENAKLTLAALDRAVFVDEINVLDHDSITKHPTLNIQDTNIVNKITINWDFDEATGKYRNVSTYEDEDSIAAYGKSTSPLTLSLKGVKEQDFVDDLAEVMLERLATPYPEIDVNTQMDKSLLQLGGKTRLITDLLANEFGDLNFASDMEIISRGINWQTGDVSFKLAYTSYTGRRLGYIAPSDTFLAVHTQDEVELNAGRGSYWVKGWKVRLWDNIANGYTADEVNEIAAVVDDIVYFVNPWATTLTTDHRLKFCDYDEATESQRRYAFVSIDNQNFSRTGKQYTIAP